MKANPISIRIDEELLNDIDAYKAADPLRYRGSRSRACVDLISTALYENDYLPPHLRRRISRRVQTVALILTIVSLFLSVVAIAFYTQGTLSAQAVTLFISCSFLLTGFILGEELLARLKRGL